MLIAAPVVLLAAIPAGYFTLFRHGSSNPSPASARDARLPRAYARKAKSLDDLLKMTPEQLADVDVAEMNLLCATGLPGTEKLDIPRCLARLDEWAAKVKHETLRHLYRAHDPKWADHYKHSENWLRAEFLAQVLQEDCGVHYNMQRVRNIDFTNPKDLFIHGMIDDTHGGTCSSMPVLYVAVGRRLGYPLRLVHTKAHVFVRWDDEKDTFNIEATSSGGADSFPDEHYRTWPEKWLPGEGQGRRYLVSLSVAEELASFLGSRGHCLLDTGRARDAFAAYAAACRLAPLDLAYLSWVRQAEARFRPPGYAAGPHGFPEPPMVYRDDPFAEAERTNAINRANMQRIARRPTGPGAAPSPYARPPGVPHPSFPKPYQPPGPPVSGQRPN